MRDAYALVVGIDSYDLDGIPSLPHCVDDAIAALSWLRSIDVPDDRIFLHLAPSTESFVKPDGVDVLKCDHRSIIRSINRLTDASAKQLFVVLSGHGLYVPSKGSIFLPTDYGVDNLKPNFWLEEYLRFFLSRKFKRQYVVYNACKEPIVADGVVSPVVPQGPPMQPETYSPSPENALTICHASAVDEKAWVGDSKGTFISYLMRELAPKRLDCMEPRDVLQSAVIYDWETGASEIDLKILFDLAVGPAFRFRALEAGHSQYPLCNRHGAAERTGNSPIIDLPGDVYLPVLVTADPPDAWKAITQIILYATDPRRDLVLPSINKQINLPMRCLGPAGAKVQTLFRANPDSSWRKRRSPAHAEIVGQGIEIVLELEPMNTAPFDPNGPPDASSSVDQPHGALVYGIDANAFNIRAIDSTGFRCLLPDSAYKAVVSGPFSPTASQDGVILEHNDAGLDIRFDPNMVGAMGSARTLALDWLRALRATYAGGDLEFHLSPLGDDFDWPTTNFRFILPPGGAQRFAGYLADAPLVSIEQIGFPEGVRKLSLAEIERHPTEYLESGFYRVKMDFPWGDWTCGVTVDASEGVAECVLPQQIGRQPLRNLISFGEVSERARILRLKAEETASYNVVVGAGDRHFAIPGAGIDLILLPEMSGIRIEPYSETVLPEWDIAFATGRASALETPRICELLRNIDAGLFRRDDERDLMLLACAYAAFGRNDAYLTLDALAEIRGEFRDSTDTHLLSHAIGLDDDEDFIRGCAESSLVPLLRWGVPVMQLILAERALRVPDWTRHLSFGSAWTTIDDEGIAKLKLADKRIGHLGRGVWWSSIFKPRHRVISSTRRAPRPI